MRMLIKNKNGGMNIPSKPSTAVSPAVKAPSTSARVSLKEAKQRSPLLIRHICLKGVRHYFFFHFIFPYKDRDDRTSALSHSISLMLLSIAFSCREGSMQKTLITLKQLKIRWHRRHFLQQVCVICSRHWLNQHKSAHSSGL